MDNGQPGQEWHHKWLLEVSAERSCKYSDGQKGQPGKQQPIVIDVVLISKKNEPTPNTHTKSAIPIISKRSRTLVIAIFMRSLHCHTALLRQFSTLRWVLA